MAGTDRRQKFARAAIESLRSDDWPRGRTSPARRKAAAIANLLALRFTSFSDHRTAIQLLNEAAKLCWWRLDAHLTRLTRRSGIALHLTGFDDRLLPHVVLRRNAHVVAMI